MRLTIFHNAVRGMRVLFDATRKLGIPLENPDRNAVFGSQLLLLDNVAAAVNEANFPTSARSSSRSGPTRASRQPTTGAQSSRNGSFIHKQSPYYY